MFLFGLLLGASFNFFPVSSTTLRYHPNHMLPLSIGLAVLVIYFLWSRLVASHRKVIDWKITSAVFSLVSIPVFVSFLYFLLGYLGEADHWNWWLGAPTLLFASSLLLIYSTGISFNADKFTVLAQGFVLSSFASVFLVFWYSLFDFSFNSPERIFGLVPLGQKNVVATFLCSCIALLVLVNRTLSKASGPIYLAYIFLSSAAVALLGSRTGLICILLICLTEFAQLLLHKKTSHFFAIVFGLILGVVITAMAGSGESASTINSIYSAGMDSVVDSVVEETGLTFRLSFLRSVWLVGSENLWFGGGLESFGLVFPESFQKFSEMRNFADYYGFTLHPHNELAVIFLGGGVVGIFVAFALCIAFVLLIKKHVSNWSWYLLPLFPIGLHSLTEFPLYVSGAHWAILFLVVVMILNSLNIDGEATATESHYRKKGIQVSGWVAALICALGSGELLRTSVVGLQWGALDRELRANPVTQEILASSFANNPARNHWAFSEYVKHQYFVDRITLSLAMQDGEAVRSQLSDTKAAVRYFNNIKTWRLMAASFAGLGMREHLVGFLDYVNNLDPVHANELRKYYGLAR